MTDVANIQVFDGDGIPPRSCEILTYEELMALARLRSFPHVRQNFGGLATWLRRLARGNRRNLVNIAAAETILMYELTGQMWLRPYQESPLAIRDLHVAMRAIRRIRDDHARKHAS